jgi:autophagy-related protein 101
MNFELIELDALKCEAYQTKEVLKILLHSIIFQRALGACRLCDAESDLLDVSYVRCDSRPICQRVEEYAEAFSNALERSAAQTAAAELASSQNSGAAPSTSASADAPRLPARICVAFIERRSRPGAFGLFRGEEKVTWERWHISLSVRAPELHSTDALGHTGGLFPAQSSAGSANEADARRRQQQQLSEDMREMLEVILTTAASRKEHLPPADSLTGDSTNWFEVTSDSESWGGLGDLIIGIKNRSFKPF